MKTERELFKEAYRKVQLMECDGDTFEQYPNGNYVRFSLNLAWLMWQASTQREGYKLVPVEPTKEMLEKIETEKEYFFHVSSDYCDLGIPSYTASEIYKTMIGATQ